MKFEIKDEISKFNCCLFPKNQNKISFWYILLCISGLLATSNFYFILGIYVLYAFSFSYG